MCNPNLAQKEPQLALNGAVTVQFNVNPKRWYRLYFYAAALGDPTVAQKIQVTINKGTQDAVVMNFTLVPGAAAAAVPGGSDNTGSGSGDFQMLSELFMLDVNVASLRFSSVEQDSIVLDQITVLEERGMALGALLCCASPELRRAVSEVNLEQEFRAVNEWFLIQKQPWMTLSSCAVQPHGR